MKLNEKQRDMMFNIRRNFSMNFDELASVLNCTKEHMVDAQIGKEIPEDVHKSVIGWMRDG